MKRYILRRVIELLIVLFIVSIIAFLLIRLAPGDPAQILAGEHVTPQILEEIREKYGLNKPIITQYFIWIGQVLRGDFGRSIRTGERVLKELFYRFANTFELSLFAIIIATIFGVFAGIISAYKRGSFFDYFIIIDVLRYLFYIFYLWL